MHSRIFSAAFGLCLLGLVTATSGAATLETVSQQAELNNTINATIERADQSPALDEQQQSDILSQLNNAKSLLENAAEQRALSKRYQAIAASASQTIEQIRQSNQSLQETPVSIDTSQSIESLANTLRVQVSEQNARINELSDKQNEQTKLSLRANEIAQQLSAARAQQSEFTEALRGQSDSDLSLPEKADYLEKLANAAKLASTINALELEIATIPARQSVVDAQQKQLSLQSAFAEKQINALQDYLAESRKSEIQKTIDRLSQTTQALQSQPALLSIARENLALANLLKDLQSRAPNSQENLSDLRKQLIEVRQASETVDRVLATGRVTDELGELLRRLRASLPSESELEQRQESIQEAAIRHQLDVILWQDRLRSLVNIEQAAERFLSESQAQLKRSTDDPDVDTRSLRDGSVSANGQHINQAQEGVSAESLAKAEALTTVRRTLLRDLIDASNVQFDRITEEKLTIAELLSASSNLRTLLERRLIWLPSNTGVANNIVINMLQSIEWYLSPSAWWTLANDLYQGVLSASLLLPVFLLIPILIIISRRRIKHILWSLVSKLGDIDKDTYYSTPYALLLTFVLALPLPIYLFVAATIISREAQPLSFSSAVATGLISAASLSLVLLFFRSMCRKNGMFDQHFGWSEIARNKLRVMLTWFTWLQASAGFLFASAVSSAQPELRYGMAVFAFMVASVGITIFTFQFFKPQNGVAATIVGETPAHPVIVFIFPVLVLVPFAIGTLPLFGYFDTAVELQSKVFMSGALLVVAAAVYGIMLRIFLVTFRRYLARRARHELQEKATQEAQAALEVGDGTAIKSEDKRLDEGEVRRQSRSIMLWTTGLLLLAGLWFVWKPLLPALGIVEDIVVWEQTRMVDGVELKGGVTLWNLLSSLVLVVGGFVAAKNIRGVMEVGVFERLEMDDGARYATMAILGYVIIGGGIVIGLAQLGIDWSKLQWIIAALGVGLGFGLQEIVANFVSGLIILFERPIRVGDFVTIGNLSGTVSNIKIRATTVTDFDNREVLLPNKSIITENVTNWTLKDPVTRVVIKIGVAYGSDVEAVRDLLMKTTKAQKDVLERPEPQVFFLAHGDSSLDFEIRAFVSLPQNRLPLTHAINVAINKALAQNNISIPFPQRDLHIVSGLPSGKNP